MSKMASAGASIEIVADAQRLRAMADVRRIELLSGPDSYAERLDDLSSRIEVFARGVAARYRDADRPADSIWSDLLTQPGLEDLDQFGLFNRDRQALLGLLCGRSDECRFGWVMT